MGLPSFARDPAIGPAADDRRHVAGTDEGVDAHVRRIEDRANRGNDRHVIAEDGEVRNAFGLGAHQRESGGGRRGFKADGEKHHVLFGIFSRELQSVGRGIDDADVHAARFVFERTAVGAGDAHHVAERGEDDVGILGDREAVVDASHGQHADGAAGAMDQLDVRQASRSFRPKR